VKALRRSAWFISYIFHPLWLLALSALWEGRDAPDSLLGLLVLALVFVPLLLLWTLRRLGKISDYHLPLRSERDIVYTLQLLWFGLLLAALSQWPAVPLAVLSRVLLAVAGLMLLALVNRYIHKSSAHMAVVTALCGVYSGAADPRLFYFSLPALALVWMARSTLKAHTRLELLSGVGCGLLSYLFWLVLTGGMG